MNFRGYVEGARVALVGPAPSIIGSKQGELIDSYDMVVRLNHALPVPSELTEDIGTRTDILYTTTKIPKTLPEDPQVVLDAGVQALVMPYYEKHEAFERHVVKCRKIYAGALPLFIPYSHKDYAVIEVQVGARPTIGLSAIIHLLSMNITELYVAGLTFYFKTEGNAGGYYEQYKDKHDYGDAKADEETAFKKVINKWKVHDPAKEAAYVAHLVRKDKRLTGDAGFTEVIERYGK
jgi:hypothetical protein